MDVLSNYPEAMKFLDPSDEYSNSAAEVEVGGDRYLIVTQTSEHDGGQVLFRIGIDELTVVDADTIVDLLASRTGVSTADLVVRAACGPSSSSDHDDVHQAAQAAVDVFSSATGPGGGNLACVWAVRHIVNHKLGRWITRTDATAQFDVELQRCFGQTSEEDEVAAGGLIISPTVTRPDGSRNIGHVGILGVGGTGAERLIYSNSSSRKKWLQNFTLGGWIQRYRVNKGLKVRFYRIPRILNAPSG